MTHVTSIALKLDIISCICSEWSYVDEDTCSSVDDIKAMILY